MSAFRGIEMKLPEDHRPYTDKYFLRSKTILQKEGLNPIVKFQVFMRNASCNVYGINEAIEIIKKYAPAATVYSLQEGEYADPCETIMLIEGRVQDVIDLETMYLGVISAETTKRVDGCDIQLREIELRMKDVVDLSRPRPVIYMGARHWRWDRDAEISKACFNAGAAACSTDIGAATAGLEGVGTIPHALEAVYHWKTKDVSSAVLSSVEAFDRHIPDGVTRIALVDYANKEISDALMCGKKLGKRLWGIRIDTCGENFIEGVSPDKPHSRGVSVEGVLAVRKALNDAGMHAVNICLSSGFGDPAKVRTFIDAEKALGVKLFDVIGAGEIFNSRVTTSDIVEVEGQEIHKIGRPYRPSARLKRVT